MFMMQNKLVLILTQSQIPLDLRRQGQPKKVPKDAYLYKGPPQRYKEIQVGKLS